MGTTLYFVDQPHRGGRLIRGLPQATSAARQLARRTGRLAHVHALRGRAGHVGFIKGALLVVAAPSGAIEYRQGVSGLGDAFTDLLCSDTQMAEVWRGRVQDGLSAGAQAAVISGAVAGFVGALIGRPLAGAALGAAAGWGAHAIWTAPHSPS